MKGVYGAAILDSYIALSIVGCRVDAASSTKTYIYGAAVLDYEVALSLEGSCSDSRIQPQLPRRYFQSQHLLLPHLYTRQCRGGGLREQ